jgi:hypothetical protein
LPPDDELVGCDVSPPLDDPAPPPDELACWAFPAVFVCAAFPGGESHVPAHGTSWRSSTPVSELHANAAIAAPATKRNEAEQGARTS